jgi:SAM-dependent methyltransferase
MPSKEYNLLLWDKRHAWPMDGDEWSDMAGFCGVPYLEWKESLAEHFIKGNVGGKIVLEIGPGHGRWTAYLAPAKKLILVDLSPNCIGFCKKLFSAKKQVECHVNDGKSLPVDDSSVDFIWSFDTFVHIEPDILEQYVQEIARVLRPGGSAVIHHPDRKFLWLAPLSSAGMAGKKIYDKLSLGAQAPNSGLRSNVSRSLVRRLSENAALEVAAQTGSWGRCNVKLFGDCITILRKH